MNAFQFFFAVLIIGLSCLSCKPPADNTASICCQECIEAFSQSPDAIAANSATCGSFNSAKALSSKCQEYFAKNPKKVSDCQ